jgi:hypothetical protein
MAASPCLQPLYVQPNGGQHWRLHVARRVLRKLPHVSYELQVRAINGGGEGVIFRKKLEIVG